MGAFPDEAISHYTDKFPAMRRLLRRQQTAARNDIVEMRPGTVSVMPQGLDEQLSRQELSDLVTFLKNTKWGPQ